MLLQRRSQYSRSRSASEDVRQTLTDAARSGRKVSRDQAAASLGQRVVGSAAPGSVILGPAGADSASSTAPTTAAHYGRQSN